MDSGLFCFGVRRQSSAATLNLGDGGYQRRFAGNLSAGFYTHRSDGALPQPQCLDLGLVHRQTQSGDG